MYNTDQNVPGYMKNFIKFLRILNWNNPNDYTDNARKLPLQRKTAPNSNTATYLLHAE